MMLAILTGFRDVNQALNLPPPAVAASAPDCGTWVERAGGWDAVARCLQWSSCDDASPGQAEDREAAQASDPETKEERASQASDPTPSPPLSRSCARLRCLCTSVSSLPLFQPDLPLHVTLVHMLPTWAICACARHCFWLACRRVARTCGCKMSVPMTPQGATGRRAWLLANTCVHQMTVQCLSMGCLRAGGALSCPRQRCHARALAPPPQPVLCYTILIVVFAIQMERKLMLYSSQDSSCSRSCARPWGARRRACIPRQRMLLT